MDRDFLFLQRFPPNLHDRVRVILERANFAVSKRGISTAPKDYRDYERGFLIGQLCQADPELAPFLAPRAPAEEGSNLHPPADYAGIHEREAG